MTSSLCPADAVCEESGLDEDAGTGSSVWFLESCGDSNCSCDSLCWLCSLLLCSVSRQPVDSLEQAIGKLVRSLVGAAMRS